MAAVALPGPLTPGPLSPGQLFARLDRLGIAHRTYTANDTVHRVAVALDKGMLDHDPLNYHPLENDRTTAIAPADLLRFIADCGHRPLLADLAAVTPVPTV